MDIYVLQQKEYMHIWDSIHCSGWGWSAKKSQSLLWQQFLRAAGGQVDHNLIPLPGTATARGQCLRRGETARAPQPEWTNPWTNSESPFASQVISSNMILYHPYWSLFFFWFWFCFVFFPFRESWRTAIFNIIFYSSKINNKHTTSLSYPKVFNFLTNFLSSVL